MKTMPTKTMPTKTVTLISILSLSLALPAFAQEDGERREREREVRVHQRILAPGSAVFVGEDGEEAVIAGKRIEFLGNGGHYIHLGWSRRQIGVQLTPLTPELREHFGVDPQVGVLVSKVSEGKPAEAAGVQVGDIVTAVDGEDVDSSSDMVRLIRAKEAGESVAVDVWRDGRALTLDVAVEEIEPPRIGRIRVRGDDDARKVVVLPEIHMRDFHLDELQLGNLAERWEGSIDLDDIEGVLERLGEYFSSEDWQERLRQIEDMDLDGVEEKMRAVEERLRRLELEIEIEE